MKKRVFPIVAVAGLAVALAATPASAAYTSPWLSSGGEVYVSCGVVLHGHSSTRAYVDSGGCQWSVAIRAQYNELGSNYTTAWVWGSPAANVTRDRISLHQFQY